jgi:uroporphyrin-III C-methyltransferase
MGILSLNVPPLRRGRGRALSASAGGAVRSPLAGVVSLVGAGPGDPGLLTLRAADRLRQADVIFHDDLVTPEVLELALPGARLVPVGRRRGRGTGTVDEIVALMAAGARAGNHVVRLKGGDPFLFGRGGEEALALRSHGIPFEIVPGVSSGTAVPAAAGIPITHRGVAGSVAFVTAHDLGEDDTGARVRERLAHLARGADTLVLFMAGAELARVSRLLRGVGLDADTPAAVIESGSRPEERVTYASLGRLGAGAPCLAAGPVLVVIGRSVALGLEIVRGRWNGQAVPATENESLDDVERRTGCST